jgi:uracil-DNA glycosylase family 4
MGPDASAVIEKLRRETLAAQCPDGRPPVFGAGAVPARLAIVGEGPAERDEATGKPFSGPAGALLDRLLERAELSRDDLWLTNVVKCRPVKFDGRMVRNRPPTQAEIRSWSAELTAELEAVQPRVVLCFGATAAAAVIRKGFKLTQERGQWFPGPAGARAMATFHPAARQPSPRPKRDCAPGSAPENADPRHGPTSALPANP